MRRDVQHDFDWADGFGAQIAGILKANVGALIDVRAASPKQDLRQATDLVVSVPEGEVAVRLRRGNIIYRHLTLRYQRRQSRSHIWETGYEVSKILAGFARWYLYAWTRGTAIVEWVIVDLDVVRSSGLIEDAIEEGRLRENKDGKTTFTWLTLGELHAIGAVVAAETDNPRRSPCDFCGSTDDPGPADVVTGHEDAVLCRLCWWHASQRRVA